MIETQDEESKRVKETEKKIEIITNHHKIVIIFDESEINCVSVCLCEDAFQSNLVQGYVFVHFIPKNRITYLAKWRKKKYILFWVE